MPRYRVTLEYDGTPFVGWQMQAEGQSVQGVLAHAAAKLCGAPVSIRGAGRTDAGVHAAGQVAHFDLSRRYPADTVRNALNFHLKPHPLTIQIKISAHFHGSVSQTKRGIQDANRVIAAAKANPEKSLANVTPLPMVMVITI